jgi:hypothetical protein
MIQVRRTTEHDSPAFEVVVREGKGETRHHVTMSQEMCERLTAGPSIPRSAVLRRRSGFCSTASQKESILRRFDVMAISRYFPEFEREMPRYLSVRGRSPLLALTQKLPKNAVGAVAHAGRNLSGRVPTIGENWRSAPLA